MLSMAQNTKMTRTVTWRGSSCVALCSLFLFLLYKLTLWRFKRKRKPKTRSFKQPRTSEKVKKGLIVRAAVDVPEGRRNWAHEEHGDEHALLPLMTSQVTGFEESSGDGILGVISRERRRGGYFNRIHSMLRCFRHRRINSRRMVERRR